VRDQGAAGEVEEIFDRPALAVLPFEKLSAPN
jgi:hypothetical protein